MHSGAMVRAWPMRLPAKSKAAEPHFHSESDLCPVVCTPFG